MNKLFFSLIILISFNSLQAMDNGKRALILAGAATSAIGGTTLADKIVEKGYKQYYHANYQRNEDIYQKAKRNYLIKSALAGALRTCSFTGSILLGCFAYSGKEPAHTTQAYASLLAIVAAGSVAEIGNARAHINWHETRENKAPIKHLLAASALVGLGIYGLYTNK